MRCSSLLAGGQRIGLAAKGFLHGLEVAILLACSHFLALAKLSVIKLSVISKRLHAVIGIAGATCPAVLIAIDGGDFNGGQALALVGLGAVDWSKEQVFFFTVATASYLRASRVMKCMSDSLA